MGSLYPASRSILKQTIENGGGTFIVDGLGATSVEPRTGYFVAVGSTVVEIPVGYRFAVGSIERGIKTIWSQYRGTYIGTWLQDGTIYLEASEWIEDRDTAIRLGNERNQQAIYDVANNEDISLSGWGN